MREPGHADPAASDLRSNRQPPVRWWPAGLILVLAGFAVVYFRVLREDSQQWRNLYSMETVLVAIVLLLFWVLFGSRLRWKIRRLVLGIVIGLIALLFALFRFHGVTGDLVPVFKFRWSRPPPSPASQYVGETTDVWPPLAETPASKPVESFPQFLGPLRNATLPEGRQLARDWNTDPPKKLWRQPIGAAWSGFAIVGNRAVTLEQQGEVELVVCYDLLSGQVQWAHANQARYSTTIAGEGPRTTPVIVGDKVVTLGATGILNCLKLASGKTIWSKDIIAENNSQMPDWGVAGSPLVLGDLVVVNPGGKPDRSLVAYRLSNGEFAWGGGEDKASYSSPCAALIGGVSQVLIFNQHAIFAHDARTGKILWQYPWDAGQPHVALPVALAGDRVLVSSGYGVGSELLQITRDQAGVFAARRLWKTNRLKAKFNNLVTHNGHIYGLDDGILACVDLETGELKWKEGRYGHGQFILLPGALLVSAENGEVVLLDPVPGEPRELTRFQALDSKTWNPPAMVGDILLVRNDREAACYRLPTAR